MLDTVLETRCGHPVVLAAINLTTVGAAGRCLVAHAGADAPVVLDPARAGGLVAPEALPPGLRWLCPHEATFAILGALIGAYALAGNLPNATHAARLRLALPLAPRLRRRVEHEIQGLEAHLN